LAARIRGVVIDYGGVLSLLPTAQALGRLRAAAGLDANGFDETWERHRRRYDCDQLSARAYWELVGGRNYDDETLERILAEDAACWARVDTEMAAWMDALKARGLRIGLLSNMPREQWARLQAGLEWLALCDAVTVSFEVQTAKPDAAMYRHCLDGLGLAPEEVVYVEDRSENIRAAEAIGMSCVLFTGVGALREELAERFGDTLPLPVTAPPNEPAQRQTWRG
jgi:putative hydrolase of the HAD superfamily